MENTSKEDAELIPAYLISIIDTLLSEITEPWIKYFIQVEMNCNDNCMLNGFYISEKTNQLVYLDLPVPMFDKFIEIRNTCIKNGSPLWTAFTFSLERNGEFKVDYSYDNLDDSNEIERRLKWKEKYLS